HNHQPVGNFGWVFEDVHRSAYAPMLGALERHPRVRLGLHYTGSLLEWLEAEHPETLERLRALVARGQVELLGGGHYEPILASLPQADRAAQLMVMADEVERLFGVRPRGAWLAERVWEPSLPADLADAGYEWTVLDDNHLRAASVPEDEMWGTYTTDDQGRRLTLFGTEQGLRYRIPFGEVEEVIDHLRRHATQDGRRLGTMGDDGEKFGAWPGTFEHCWGDGAWVDRCFAAFEANADWLTTTTPSAWLDTQPPVGRIYVPTASYVEMTQWALPANESGPFHDALEAARLEGRVEARFLRGGFWRNFMARYREINDLHKQMLRASRKVAAISDPAVRRHAREHLLRGQSNDVYWHGLFGGIYIVHMRLAVLAELIAAEDLADGWAAGRTLGAPSDTAAFAAGLVDSDLDGVDEALLSTPGQVVVVDLAEGAGIGSWDLRAARLALASVLRRRPEAYHETLRQHEARAAGDAAADPAAAGATEGTAGDAPRTIHDVVQAKEPGLTTHLVYDWHERRSSLVHLLPAVADGDGIGPTELSSAAYRELGDFADQPFEVVSLDARELVIRRHGHLHVEGGPHALRVTKSLRLGGGRLDPTLSLETALRNDSGVESAFELALEWGLQLMGGGGNPAAYYELPAGKDAGGAVRRLRHDGTGDEEGLDGFACGNDDVGVRIDVRATPAARVTWYPIETVSNSEAGFERVYQGSALLLRWPLRLAPGEEQRFEVHFAARQAEDATPSAAAVGER
ncbi:MAG TPA: alpha-amylase/4-alpha-glucanotransferase domain-containing protein, partial [Candidatus Limnocylindrales bacterium]|nr:alpha-amylase/4-alpha-glucanotransferase domain-containing protein [Candidatus Limnocylindrales bacterium]